MYSLEPPRRGGSNEYPQSMLSENFQFFGVKFSIYLNMRVFVMSTVSWLIGVLIVCYRGLCNVCTVNSVSYVLYCLKFLLKFELKILHNYRLKKKQNDVSF